MQQLVIYHKLVELTNWNSYELGQGNKLPAQKIDIISCVLQIATKADSWTMKECVAAWCCCSTKTAQNTASGK